MLLSSFVVQHIMVKMYLLASLVRMRVRDATLDVVESAPGVLTASSLNGIRHLQDFRNL